MKRGAVARGCRLSAVASLCTLLLLCLAWELWLSPLRPGGSWLALKVVPLLSIAPGIARGRIYTYRASTMLILAYVAEGVVRAWSEQGLNASLAAAEIALSAMFFVAAIAYVRISLTIRAAAPATAA